MTADPDSLPPSREVGGALEHYPPPAGIHGCRFFSDADLYLDLFFFSLFATVVTPGVSCLFLSLKKSRNGES